MSPRTSIVLPLVTLLLSVMMLVPARASPDFTLNIDRSTIEVEQGSSSNSTILLTSQGASGAINFSFTGQNWTFTTQLSVNNAPLSMNRTFLPLSGSDNVTLTVSVPTSAPPGCCHILNVTGTSSTGTSHSAILNVTVRTSYPTTNNPYLILLLLVGFASILLAITALTIILLKRSRRIVRHPFVP